MSATGSFSPQVLVCAQVASKKQKFTIAMATVLCGVAVLALLDDEENDVRPGKVAHWMIF
jgi:hypothetical protein